eukprot:3960816-Alexandrium_andersonii.AAC.1
MERRYSDIDAARASTRSLSAERRLPTLVPGGLQLAVFHGSAAPQVMMRRPRRPWRGARDVDGSGWHDAAKPGCSLVRDGASIARRLRCEFRPGALGAPCARRGSDV